MSTPSSFSFAAPGEGRLRLLLWGWVSPPDTSINTALTQGSQPRRGAAGPLAHAGALDRYVVMEPGDELTLRYPAAALPPLPAGRRRDFVLYTDGWVKDADLNTRHSATVEPWPYHGMAAYPDRPAHRHPGVRGGVERDQTRVLDGGPFSRALRERPRPGGSR